MLSHRVASFELIAISSKHLVCHSPTKLPSFSHSGLKYNVVVVVVDVDEVREVEEEEEEEVEEVVEEVVESVTCSASLMQPDKNRTKIKNAFNSIAY